MDKFRSFIKSKAAWATAGVLAGTIFGLQGTTIVKAVETIACTVQACT